MTTLPVLQKGAGEAVEEESGASGSAVMVAAAEALRAATTQRNALLTKLTNARSKGASQEFVEQVIKRHL